MQAQADLATVKTLDPALAREPQRAVGIDAGVLAEDHALAEMQRDPPAAKGIQLGIALQKKIGVGFFGGEGFIMQRLDGDGMAFMHAGGTIIERTLQPGETLRIDTGCIVAHEESVDFDIQFVGGLKSAIFGGEGLFFANLTGPGRIWMQTLPFSRLADRVYSAAPQTGGRRQGEGSILGGLGDMLDGDN